MDAIQARAVELEKRLIELELPSYEGLNVQRLYQEVERVNEI